MELEQWLERNAIPEPNTGCWLWLGADNGLGYGQFWQNGRRSYAHRHAVTLSGRALRRGAVVMHICDTPACVNPNHLRVGTQLENLRDMHAKGRAVVLRGEDSPFSRLTSVQVAEIRARRKAGEKGRVIAQAFGVSEGLVSMIVNGKVWKHVEKQ